MGKRYSEEFRVEALKLMEEIGRGAAAKKLGISVNSLDEWRNKTHHPSKGTKAETEATVAELQEQIKAMEKEMSRIRKENEFLEEATRFFASHRQK
jgi:transposase